MTTNERRRRPPLDRTSPLRDWSALLGGAAAGTPGPGDDRPRSDPASRVTDAVSKSVELGYRVVDDYLQQGQRVARRLSDGGSAPEVLATEIQDLGARMARYASDFMAAWMELIELTARGGAAPMRPSPAASHEDDGPTMQPGPAAAPRPAPPANGARVRIALTSALPVAVDVDFRPERVTGPAVRAHALRALEPEKPRIEEVALGGCGTAEPPTLTIRIPPDQPAGSYEGLLVDEATNRPVGSFHSLSTHGIPCRG
jgi:hypothetical protein